MESDELTVRFPPLLPSPFCRPEGMVGARCGHHSGMTAEGKIDTMEDEPAESGGEVPPSFEDFCDTAAPLLREALRKNPRLLEDATVAWSQDYI